MLVHKANRHVLHGGNGCEWVDPGLKLVTVGGNGLKMSGNGIKMSESGWSGRERVGARFKITPC